MPLTSKDAALFIGGPGQEQVAPNVWVSPVMPSDDSTTLVSSGGDSARVNLRINPPAATALGKALSFLRQHEGEPVVIAGPDTDAIVTAYRG
jgi:hypothetical protein